MKKAFGSRVGVARSLTARCRLSLTAFTLTELLLVIAIVAILACLLLPLLSKAKAKAITSQCINNNKEMAVSFAMWGHDHNEGKYPWNDGKGKVGPDPLRTNWITQQRYLRNCRALTCPADVKRVPIKDWDVMLREFNFRLNLSYMFCADSLPKKPMFFLTSDNYLSTDYPANNTWALPDNPANGSRHSFSRVECNRRGWVNNVRHVNLGVSSFADGSVSTLSSQELQERLLFVFDHYLTASTDTLKFMLPQYSNVPY
jgi:prepilin-type N-terminal cleavage/methylation domain-containing protein